MSAQRSLHQFGIACLFLVVTVTSSGQAQSPAQSQQSHSRHPKIALVLSGGGARGIAAIGVLKSLEANKIPVDLIVGTSMGSVIGGFYAAGYSPDELQRIVDSTNWEEVINYNDESARREMFIDQKLATDRSVILLRFEGLEPIIPSAYSQGQKLNSYLNYYALQALYHPFNGFDDFRIPFRAVTTDLISGRQFVIKSGDLAQALRASVAVPLLFSSVRRDTMQLLDGGLLSNLPVDVARQEGADIVIAVDVTSPLRPASMVNAPWEVAEQLMGVMMQGANELARKKSDVVIRPAMEARTSADFSDLDSIIARGEEATNSAIEKIRALLLKAGHIDDSLENQSYPIARVRTVNVARIDSATASNAVAEVVGLPATEPNIRQARERLLREYRKRGLSLARIAQTEYDSVSATLTIIVDEGMVYRMDVKGTSKTKDYILWREMPLLEGDIFEMGKFAQGLRNIYSTGLFESVIGSVHLEVPDSVRQVITIHAKERSTELIRIGLRLDSERNFQPSVDIRDEDFLGIGSELGVRFSGGQRNQTYTADFRIPRIFNSYFSFDVRGYSATRDVNYYQDSPGNTDNRFSRDRTGEYREVREGGALALGTQLERLGSFTVEGRLEHHYLYNLFATPIANQDYAISSVRFATNLDTQDRFPYPTDGINFRLMYESALYKVGDAIGYTKLFFQYDFYQAIAKGNTVHGKLVLGAGDKTVPLSEQYSLGGQQSFIGYREDNQRGQQLLIGSLEYRWRLPISFFFDSYAMIRYDLGSIWTQPEQIRFEDLKHGIGISLGFDTPIGPAEFSVGKAFYIRNDILERPLSLGPTTLYFSVGYPLLFN